MTKWENELCQHPSTTNRVYYTPHIMYELTTVYNTNIKEHAIGRLWVVCSWVWSALLAWRLACPNKGSWHNEMHHLGNTVCMCVCVWASIKICTSNLAVNSDSLSYNYIYLNAVSLNIAIIIIIVINPLSNFCWTNISTRRSGRFCFLLTSSQLLCQATSARNIKKINQS